MQQGFVIETNKLSLAGFPANRHTRVLYTTSNVTGVAFKKSQNENNKN